MRGAFNHNWDPYWSTSVFGAYTAVRYSDEAAGITCNPDFNTAQLGAITRWTPVKNLTFSAEVMWFHLDQKFTGAALFAANGPKPAAVYEFKDQDTVALNVRVQRNF